MTQGPLEKAISRRQELLTRNSELRAEIDRNTAEIAQIDSALVVMRKFAPLGQLPGMDEDVRSVYGDLASMTVPDGLATILYKRGEPLTSRELLTVLEKAGKLESGSKNNLIGVIGALKRHSRRFRKVGSSWTLIESSHQLRVLDGTNELGADG
jgi:hypothetical protein